ncbi:MAG: hypothetical protein UY36_C0010G0003 [Parcubacteria group bacterium GW2011_GWA1_49_11]|uniref:Addiction module toxin, HicA family n=1 Tax=Candidatus Yanofskybacteria bacterium RIFCSPHIGHO2_01_FULL_48_25b TaxID=1802672 RepID=A0A1F8F1A8_9BACT|nr:MAG: hypothetical protein UY36_C0010G0003 [Parcubacteria group bacterium GW2011_GWA1_49_11]OGN06905.1 MAG: hypothetical protein A2669_02190 [Candidatus Yanofskybacteria bacterium RIFCSPHIGHO2_01_FULL_48_25b]
MKRRDLFRFLKRAGCIILREGAKHSVFLNPKNNKTGSVPRHNEINNFTAEGILKDLQLLDKFKQGK